MFKRTSWGASLPQQPIGTGRKKGTELEPKPPGKQPPAVVVVQKALVEHLQRAYPILDGSIVQLIVEDQGEDNIDEAVKILSSLAADAEKEAAASRYVTLHICFVRVTVAMGPKNSLGGSKLRTLSLDLELTWN
jgi:hypothetical protein